jgi:hypothetical protein
VSARRCSSTETERGVCNAYALADSDPPLCAYHSMSEAERQAWKVKGGKARVQKQRLRADQEERLSGIAFGVSTEQILKVCKEALDAKLITGEPDWGARLSACAILLQVFPKSLRTTVEEAKEILDELFTGTRHAALKERAVREHFKAMRAEWVETMTRCDSLGRLYVTAFPPMLLGPGDTPSSVRHELPSFEEWKTEQLKDGDGRLLPYARVTRPDGSTDLVARDDSVGQREAA